MKRGLFRAGLAALLVCGAMAARADLSDSAAAVQACMTPGRSDQASRDCMQGLALLAAIEGLREAATTGRVPGGAAFAVGPRDAAQGQPQVLVQAPPANGWSVFKDIVVGVAQFAKDTAIALASPIAQVYVARSNNATQQVVAGYNRDTQIATVGAFSNMGSNIRDAGTYGYQFIQAPAANVSVVASGPGSAAASGGSATGSAPTTSTTTTTTDNHANPAPMVVTCVGTPPTCSR